MFQKLFLAILCTTISITTYANQHFQKIMIVMFENMSYAEIKNEPTFKRLIEYSGNTLDTNGRLLKLLKAGPKQDNSGNGYAFFSSYYNNHTGGDAPTRPSQPNYIAMTSGSIHQIADNEIHDLDVDNLGNELIDAGVTWKVYADDLPDPTLSKTKFSLQHFVYNNILKIKNFFRDPNKTEQENDNAEHQYFLQMHKTDTHKLINILTNPQCFTGESNVEDKSKNADDGYERKHEPFISYLNIQNNQNHCKNIVNSSHLAEDIDNMPAVSFYIPNQINDGHNGTLAERTVNANAFLSKMLGTDPNTGEPLQNTNDAPFQKFMSQGGLLVITFDEPSVSGNPDLTLYTLFAGRMINSSAYPTINGDKLPICYPSINEQTNYPSDEMGEYEPTHCNHYNLLKMIEENWQLRGLDGANTSSGYKYAYSLDHTISELWR